MNAPGGRASMDDAETALLLDAVYRQTGYDFRDYSPASRARRVRERQRAEKVPSIAALRDLILRDREAMRRFLHGMTISVSSMFRDPGLYRAFRSRVVPILRTYPFVRIWHAGCSTGEEVYSMAILLEEEDIYDRCRLYATDMNEQVLDQARQGIYPIASMKEFTENYRQAGGLQPFSDYYTARYDGAIIRSTLRRNIIFAQHNLVTDGPFNEFHVIVCRNVLIYFNPALQTRVHDLLLSSLVRFGFLVLGAKESLRFKAHELRYEEIDPENKIYRRIS
ncbi:MAG TPA: protein-glutamate O-methyltransferase CheR [Dehalococcoidia bacterium]|nr:protein-glutamate O-methyltransferase CheR [Dehalococcoidia bacterium]